MRFAFPKSIRDRDIFSYVFSIDVFHTFVKTDDCVGSPTLLTAVMTKRPLGNLFGPQPRLTCDADKVSTRAYSAFRSSSSFTLPSCSAFVGAGACSSLVASSSLSYWSKFK
jgi:hypothetical protein